MREDDESDDAVDPGEDEDTIPGGPLFGDEFMSAVILRPRAPFLEWVGQHLEGEPMTPDHEAAGPVVAITPELPLVQDQEAWLRQFSDQLFARQLEPWAGEADWPEDRSPDALREWFDVEFANGVDDLRDHQVRPAVTCGPVSLAELVDEFQVVGAEGSLFVDVRSGLVLALSENELDAIESGDAEALGIPDADLETMRRAYESPSLVGLMTRNDFDEFAAMASFAESQPIASIRNRLLDALRGRKPFRRFKDAVDAAGVREKWFAWRDAAVANVLKVILDDEGIPYVDERGLLTAQDEPES